MSVIDREPVNDPPTGGISPSHRFPIGLCPPPLPTSDDPDGPLAN